MKKIITTIIMVFIVSQIAQTQDNTFHSLDSYLSEFQTEADLIEVTDSTIILEDASSLRDEDVIFNLSFMLSALDYYLQDNSLSLSDLGTESLTYRLSSPNKTTEYEEIQISISWVESYFRTQRSEKSKLLIEAIQAAKQ